MAEGVSKYFCYDCNFAFEPIVGESVCPVCSGSFVEERINERIIAATEDGGRTGMMLTHALMNSIVRHAQRSSSANSNSRINSPSSFLSAQSSRHFISESSFHPQLSSFLHPSTSLVSPNIHLLGPRTRLGQSEFSAPVELDCCPFSFNTTLTQKGDMQEGEFDAPISVWSQTSMVAFRETDDEMASKISPYGGPLLSKTSSVETNIGQLEASTFSSSTSVTIDYGGTEVADHMTDISDPLSYSDFTTSSRLTHPFSAISSRGPSYLSRLAWFDVPPRPHTADDQSSEVAEADLPQSNNGQLMNGLRWSQSEQPLGSSGSTAVVTDEEDRAEHGAMIHVSYDEEPTNMPRPLTHALSITQLLHDFFFSGQPVVVPFGNTSVHLNPGLVSSVVSRDRPYNFQAAMGVFDRVITQLLNQLNVGPAPASLPDIQAVPFIRINADHFSSMSQCAICIEDFQLNQSARQMSCGHIFHSECLIRWLELHGTCPVCRCRVSGAFHAEFGRLSDEASISSVSVASAPLVELTNVDDDDDIVTSILDDVTGTLLARSLPTGVAAAAATAVVTQTAAAPRPMDPAVADVPLFISRAPTPMFSLRSDHQVVPDEEIAVDVL